MGARYTVSTEIGFSASHSLSHHEGDCRRLHGHNWVVRVSYEFERLDDAGLTVAFLVLRRQLEAAILPRFDHRHLNDMPPFEGVDPTSERIAAEIHRVLGEEVVFDRGRLVEVELWETPVDMVRYREEG